MSHIFPHNQPFHILIIAVLLSITGCSTLDRAFTPKSPESIVSIQSFEKNTFYPSEKTKVGVLVPLSGNNAAVGQSLYEAAQLAIHYNKYHELSLYPFDSTKPGVIEEIKKQQIQVVIGPLFTDEARRLYPALAEAGIPMFSFSNDNTLTNHIGLNLLGISLEAQFTTMASHITAKGYREIFAVYPNGRFGDVAQKQFTAYRAGAPFEIIKTYRYSGGGDATSFNAIATDIKTLMKPGLKYAIIFPEGGAALQNFARTASLTLNEEDIALFGSSQWGGAVGREENQLKDLPLTGYYPSVDMVKVERFSEQFQQSYSYEPDVIAALGADGVIVVGELVRQLKRDNYSFINPTEIYGIRLNNTVTGPFTLTSTGSAERHLKWYKVP